LYFENKCPVNFNEMKPRLTARLNDEVGQGRAGKESQSKNIFTGHQ